MKTLEFGKVGLAYYSAKAIVILSSGLYKVATGGIQQSWDAKLRMMAGAHLYRRSESNGVSPQIFVTGGHVYKNSPSLAEVGKQKLVDDYYIPSERVGTIAGSNTSTELRLIRQSINDLGIGSEATTVASSIYHLVAQKLTKQMGFNFIPAEEVVWQMNEKYQPIIESLVKCKGYLDLINSQAQLVKFVSVPLLSVIVYESIATLSHYDLDLEEVKPNELEDLVRDIFLQKI